jgi:hypothetical protein
MKLWSSIMALSNLSNTANLPNTANLSNAEEFSRVHALPETDFNPAQANVSAVSWAAILAGASAVAALSLILLLLGAGLGLSSVSPWAHKGISASTFGLSTIVWLAATQIIAAGMGGYLTGRLRVRWADVQADEVYFRDTAHGFLAWAVASLATAALLASAIGSIVNGGVQTATTLTAGATAVSAAGGVAAVSSKFGKPDSVNESDAGAMGYFVDSLFRKDTNTASSISTASNLDSTANNVDSTANAQNIASTTEVTRIFANSMSVKSLPSADLSYIGQLVSSHTGLTQQEAEKRVSDIYASMQRKVRNAEIAGKEAADKARKASIYATLWLFASLLMGAFSASLAATWGGRCRDA